VGTTSGRKPKPLKRMSIKRLKRLRRDYAVVYNFCIATSKVGLKSANEPAQQLRQIIDFISMKLIENKNKYYVVF